MRFAKGPKQHRKGAERTTRDFLTTPGTTRVFTKSHTIKTGPFFLPVMTLRNLQKSPKSNSDDRDSCTSRRVRKNRRRPETLKAILLTTLSLSLTGCLERLLQIRSEPAGAEVYINGDLVLLEKDGESVPATTPVDVEFDSYGTFEIQLRHPDRRSESRLVPISAPLYDYPPLDLVLGFLWPWTVSDAHLVEFTLEPLL